MNCDANPLLYAAKEKEEDPMRIVGHPTELHCILFS